MIEEEFESQQEYIEYDTAMKARKASARIEQNRSKEFLINQ